MGVSIKDIAARAGTSNVTVSLALRDHPRISLARRQQIKMLAEEMGYRPDAGARALRTQRSLSVGLLLTDLRTGVSNLKVDAIESLLATQGYSVLLGFTGGDSSRLQSHIESMASRRVDGLIVYGSHGSAGDWELVRKTVGDSMPPCVLADFQLNVKGARIEIDRANGMAQITRHLLKLNHRDIAFVTAPDGPTHKWKGVQRALREWASNAPVAVRPFLLWPPKDQRSVAKAPVELTSLSQYLSAGAKVGRDIADLPDSKRPTAVIAMSDVVAMSVVRGLNDGGLRVPQDISVCGFDGEDFATLVFQPSLTTVRQPLEELAEQVVQLLLKLMNGSPAPSTFVSVKPKLVIGRSTAPATQRLSRR